MLSSNAALLENAYSQNTVLPQPMPSSIAGNSHQYVSSQVGGKKYSRRNKIHYKKSRRLSRRRFRRSRRIRLRR